MRDRGSVVIIENNKVALIKRTKNTSLYYVFPGGGIENEETPEEAAKREAMEELGVEVKVKNCIAEVEFNGTQYYFLAEIIGGTFGTGKGEEFKERKENRGTYLPVWMEVEKLSEFDVRPREVAVDIQALFR